MNAAHLFKLVDGKELKEVQTLPLQSAPWDAAFDKEDNLWVSTSSGVEAFGSNGSDDSYSPVGEGTRRWPVVLLAILWWADRVGVGDAGHALSAALQQLSEKREQQAKAVLEKNVEKALAYGGMRKRTAEDKEQAKRRKLEEANANPTGGAKEKRKQRRNKTKKGTAEASKQAVTPMDEEGQEAKHDATAEDEEAEEEEKTSSA